MRNNDRELPLEFSSIVDDFFMSVSVLTNLPLPTSRETVLHFYEAVQKEFPDMTSFYSRETGEFVLEGNRDSGSYGWVEIHPTRLSAGYFNPNNLESAFNMQRWLLHRSTYFLGMSGLDIEAIDVCFGFNIEYEGNRDAIVSEALLANSPLAQFANLPGVKPLQCEPSITIAMDEDCCLQSRLVLETRSSSHEVRTGDYESEPITVYFTVRRYPKQGELMDMHKTFEQNREICEDYSCRVLVPHVIGPIVTAISSSR